MSETTAPLDLNVTVAPATLPVAPPPLPQVVAPAMTTQTAEATVVTPKKRGRPRKAPVPEGEAPPKRRRGRPRKAETEARLAAEAAAAAAAGLPPPVPGATPEPKKRGRPKKDPSVDGPPKKRGRPRKVREEGAETKPADSTPKKRGRPRKNPAGTPTPAAGTPGAPVTATPVAVAGAPGAAPQQAPTAGTFTTTTTITSAPVAVPVAVQTTVPAPLPVITPISTNGTPIQTETKESDTVSEPRMESRKRRRAAASPAREKKASKKEPARKKVKGKRKTDDKKEKEEEEEEEEKEEKTLDFDHLHRHSLEELQKFVKEKQIDMRLYSHNGKHPSKEDYIHAILHKHLSPLTLAELKREVQQKKIDMSEDYGKNPRKADYVLALIDYRMGNMGDKLWDGWKKIYLVGTEWQNYDAVFDIKWDFNHLGEALEEGGELYEAGAKHPVYLFGVTEPQYITVDDSERVVHIPAVVAVVSALAPPSELRLKSVQKEEEESVPMKELKMDWVPMIPKEEWKTDPRAYVPRAFYLATHQRREGLKDMKEEEIVKFNYALPYIFLPRAQTEPTSDSTIVNVVTEVNGKGATFEFDWELDELDEFSENLLKEYELDPTKETEKLEALKQTIRDTVNAEKKRIRQEKADWKSKIEGLSPEKKKALDELQIWKYYPHNTNPDISKNKVAFVNRYYGKADKIL